MFNVEQPAMACRTDMADQQRFKRPLSVIEEHLDEDTAPEENNNATTATTTTTNNNNRSRQEPRLPEIPESNGTSEEETTATSTGTQPTCSAHKTRRKAISTSLPPSLDTLQANGGSDDVANHNCSPENQRNDLTVTRKERSDAGTEGDLSRLKDTATKLNLKTRRPSYLTWRAEYVDKPREPPQVKVVSKGDGRLTRERKTRIDHDLEWIKGQLIDLRRQDQSLARQLLGIRHELSNLRLAVSCEEHKDLLDDAHDHMEELRELSRFADFPPDLLSSSPLRQIGVTKMNLSSRRFSTC